MLHDRIIAAIRTGCAVLGATVVTYLVSLLAGQGIAVEVDPELSSILAVLLFGIIVALYNFVVAWLTENVWDGFGWLLGVNKPPSYVEADARTTSGGVAVNYEPVNPGPGDSDSPEYDQYSDPERA